VKRIRNTDYYNHLHAWLGGTFVAGQTPNLDCLAVKPFLVLVLGLPPPEKLPLRKLPPGQLPARTNASEDYRHPGQLPPGHLLLGPLPPKTIATGQLLPRAF